MSRIAPTMRGLYKRGGTYWISYSTSTGVVRESTGTRDRRLAEGVLSKRRAEVFEGRWTSRVREAKVPLSEAIQEFLTVYSKPRKVSWRDDQVVLLQMTRFLGPNTYLHTVDRRQIERFHVHLLAQGITKSRVNRYTATLKCFFNRCIDWYKIATNPCRGIKLYPETPRTSWLETGQVTELLAHCSLRLRPIVQVALLTGLRQGDILRLKWDQVDFEQGLIRLMQGKTQTPLLLPVSEALAAVLRRMPQTPDNPHIFHHRNKALRPFGWLRSDFLKATRAAGLSGIRFHDLRHTAATQLRRLGRDLQVVQQLLGHKTIRTTMRYSHVHPTELREAVNSLGEKILPLGQDHFTITSQSGFSSLAEKNGLVRNGSILLHESKSSLKTDRPLQQTVNLSDASTEDW